MGSDFGSSSQYVNCISDFAFLPVNCFQSFSCAKKRHESNKSVEIVHELQFLTTYYRNTNDVSTHAWPWLILHTVHRHDIVAYSRARACCACSWCGTGELYCFYIFHISSLSNALSFGRRLNMNEILWFRQLNKNQKWDPLRAMKTFIKRKVGHTT